jgi:hypothetical protein
MICIEKQARDIKVCERIAEHENKIKILTEDRNFEKKKNFDLKTQYEAIILEA